MDSLDSQSPHCGCSSLCTQMSGLDTSGRDPLDRGGMHTDFLTTPVQVYRMCRPLEVACGSYREVVTQPERCENNDSGIHSEVV